ncbi:MAG TPA: 3-oxoacyl-ACP reductase [Solirubrobacteraceae bacterium]|nr:3-oxoacyl-ACP reductase [Solirubrobacteraceae bacterium]
MSDRYAQLLNAPLAGSLARRVGLPQPIPLERHRPGDPVIRGRVLLGAAPGGRLVGAVAAVLAQARAEVASGLGEPVRSAVAAAGLDAAVFNPQAPGEQRFKALVLDAGGIATCTELVALQEFFHPTVRRIERCGRVVVLGTPPQDCASPRAATAQRALEGFTRSLGKEIGRGATVQLVYVAPGAEGGLASTLRFLLSPRSAYVSGQVVRLAPPASDAARGGTARPEAGGAARSEADRTSGSEADRTSRPEAGGAAKESEIAHAEIDWERPFAGRTALVTGAARGIGEAIATVLARDGAHVVGLDVPALAGELGAVAQRLGGEALELDITSPSAPAAIARRFADGLDVLVHNAGVTRDRTLAKMPAERWSELMEINLCSQERIDDELLQQDVLRPGGRIVCVSSMSGIAGNAGQTNYATSKAGVIGMVQAMAPTLAERGLTINAVAPGFIETAMTARMPIAIREAGRRMSSLSQGGLPVDVAETVAWLAHPGSGAINGNVVRVCGQNLLGA